MRPARWPGCSRAKLREPLDPDKVVLENISVKDGSLIYADASSGVALAFDGISAQLRRGRCRGRGMSTAFISTTAARWRSASRPAACSTTARIRVKADVNPARWPVTVGVDGPVGIDPDEGLTWRGTYSVSEVATDDGGGGGATAARGGQDAADGPSGWRSEGAFALTGDRLDISKAVLSNGPVDRPLSVAGTLTLNFGTSPSFAASAEARQIDLDRTLGNGPSAAGRRFGGGRQPGRLAEPASGSGRCPATSALSVPAIVVGGRIIENVGFTAAPAPTRAAGRSAR